MSSHFPETEPGQPPAPGSCPSAPGGTRLGTRRLTVTAASGWMRWQMAGWVRGRVDADAGGGREKTNPSQGRGCGDGDRGVPGLHNRLGNGPPPGRGDAGTPYLAQAGGHRPDGSLSPHGNLQSPRQPSLAGPPRAPLLAEIRPARFVFGIFPGREGEGEWDGVGGHTHTTPSPPSRGDAVGTHRASERKRKIDGGRDGWMDRARDRPRRDAGVLTPPLHGTWRGGPWGELPLQREEASSLLPTPRKSGFDFSQPPKPSAPGNPGQGPGCVSPPRPGGSGQGPRAFLPSPSSSPPALPSPSRWAPAPCGSRSCPGSPPAAGGGDTAGSQVPRTDGSRQPWERRPALPNPSPVSSSSSSCRKPRTNMAGERCRASSPPRPGKPRQRRTRGPHRQLDRGGGARGCATRVSPVSGSSSVLFLALSLPTRASPGAGERRFGYRQPIASVPPHPARHGLKSHQLPAPGPWDFSIPWDAGCSLPISRPLDTELPCASVSLSWRGNSSNPPAPSRSSWR